MTKLSNALKISRAVVFDMDGVLVDSEPLHVKSERMVCEALGLQVPLEEWKNFKGKTPASIGEYILRRYSNGNVSAEEFVRLKTQYYFEIAEKQIVLIPGSFSFLKQCRQYYQKVALATSATQEVQNYIFAKFNFWGIFDVILTGDEVKHGKPHPEIYATVAEKLSVPGSSCMAIEDSNNGVRSAREAGYYPVIGITTSFSREELWYSGADFVVESFEELCNCLR